MAIFLNKVEMAGIVGQSRVTAAGERSMARFSLALNYAYRDRDGGAVIETTWVNCTAWDGKDMADLGALAKGTKVRLRGRLRCVRYTDSSGTDMVSTEVAVSHLEILPEGESMELETP